jgi:hypothetical protein
MTRLGRRRQVADDEPCDREQDTEECNSPPALPRRAEPDCEDERDGERKPDDGD